MNVNMDRLLNDRGIPAVARQLMNFLYERYENIHYGEILAAGVLAKMQNEGHTRIDLQEVGGKPVFEGSEMIYYAPSFNQWHKELTKGRITGNTGEFKPLIIENERWVYFQKHWVYEDFIARWIHKWAQKKDTRFASGKVDVPGELNAEQQKAIQVGLERQLLIITGGPGTGKTHVISHLLKSITTGDQSLRVALSAPTGKAAARLNQSLGIHNEPDTTLRAVTIHSLLGKSRNGSYRYNAKNKLTADLLVIDEASMIDISLMYHLLQAVPESCKVIFLGDENQLASVEAGAILGDLVQAAATDSYSTSLSACLVQLTHSYRFGKESGVGLLAEAVKNQDFDTVMEVLSSDRYKDARMIEKSFSASLDEIYNSVLKPNFSTYTRERNTQEALSSFNSSKILLPLRSGVQGLEWVNHHLEERIKKDFGISGLQEWFHGRPVTITKNNYALNLRNGESGICWNENESVKVLFGSETDERGVKALVPGQLSGFETGYTMSIHKSQGSEYDHVIILLPEADFPILTRELLYTAVTRARLSVLVYTNASILEACLTKIVNRNSGIKEKILLLES